MNEKNVLSSSLCGASATVKFNINEMDKSDLIEMLAFMQSELEAREVAIATLKSEKCKQLLYQAKYGRLNTSLVSPKVSSDFINDHWTVANSDSIFSIYDPFVAMQRDIQHVIGGNDQSIDCSAESNLKPVYDSQLSQLENLISSQKKAQMKMKEQIMYLEKKCVKLTQALEDERNKHERDAAQGDDVLVMLEKERERLKSELDYERSHSRKLERELKRIMAVIEDQKTVIHNQRLAASVIIKAKSQIESDFKAVNLIINKTVNASELMAPEVSVKQNQELLEHPLSNPVSVHSSSKISSDRPVELTERHKDYSVSKSLKHNTNDPQSIAKYNIKYNQPKEPVSGVSTTISEPIINISHQVMNPVPKTRQGKQPESLLWKTYDLKCSLPNTGNNPASLTCKSPSNVRRQLPTVSMSIPLSRQNETNYYKHSSTSSVSSTSSPAITPYQKILSTPPPNSIINQAASFQSSLTNYGLFNICTPSLQSLSNNPTVATIYKSTISSAKTDIVNCQPINASRSRFVATPTSVATSSAASNSSIIRSGDSSPAIPKHVYVNGK